MGYAKRDMDTFKIEVKDSMVYPSDRSDIDHKKDCTIKGKSEGYIVRVFKEGDESGMAELFALTAYKNPYEEWLWKYKSSPSFDSALIVATEKDGEIVGGIHAQRRSLKIDDSLNVDASIGSGLIVDSKHRRHGVATEMMKILRANLKKKGVILHYSVPESWAFRSVYSKRDALMVGKEMHRNARYSKHLLKNVIRHRVALANEIIERNPTLRSMLGEMKLSVKLIIMGVPYSTFSIALDDGELSFKEAGSEDNDILLTARDITSSLTSLLKMFLRGELRTKGLIRNSGKLVKFLRIWRKISAHRVQHSE